MGMSFTIETESELQNVFDNIVPSRKEYKTMQYIGIVKSSRNGDLHHINSEYSNKLDFAKDLRNNGYRVVAILTDKEIEQIKNSDIEILHKYLNLDFEYVRQCL